MSHSPFPIMDGNAFPPPAFPLSLEAVAFEQPQGRDEKLNMAVNKLIPTALVRRQGILIIQRDNGHYTVRVDPEVPCGTTQECRG